MVGIAKLEQRNALRVLVVDDDADVAGLLKDVLEANGCEPTTVTDPSQAMEELRRGDYHIVVLDVMMPVLSGMDLLADIRTQDRDVAVILLTGHPSLETAMQSIEHEVSAYLKKPFDIDELRRVLGAIAERKGLASSAEDQLLQRLGVTVRETRKARGLTLKQLSRRTGLSVSLLSQIERAETAASIASLYRLARALGMRMSELFTSF